MRSLCRTSLFANIGYIDAKFDDPDKDGNPALFAGNRFRLQPEWSTAAGIRWNQPIASGMAWFGSLAWSYRSRVFSEEDNAPVAGVDISEDSVHLVDLRTGLTGAAGQLGTWTLTGYASNLLKSVVRLAMLAYQGGTRMQHHIDAIEEYGYTIIPDVLRPEEADRLREDLERIERACSIVPACNPFEGHHTVRIYNLLARGECYARIPVDPAVLPVVEAVLDPGCLISSLSSIAIGPGETAQMLHSDDQVIGLPRPHPALVCNTMWALTDFTADNGATRVVPGSHKATRCPDPSGDAEAEAAAVPAEMSTGSVLIWHGSLWHGGGANATPKRRVGIAMNYCAGFIRQQENQQLGIPREIARDFSPRLKELVGYGVYRGLIGHIDKRSPAGLLGDDDRLKTIWDT